MQFVEGERIPCSEDPPARNSPTRSNNRRLPVSRILTYSFPVAEYIIWQECVHTKKMPKQEWRSLPIRETRIGVLREARGSLPTIPQAITGDAS